MAWHLSKALVVDFEASNCSQEQAAESSEVNSLDGGRFALLKSSDFPETYSLPDKTTGALDLFQYGTMSEPLTANLGEDLLTWFREGFRAKTSASSADRRESAENDQGCGITWLESSKKFSPDGYSSRTWLNCDVMDLQLCSMILPAWGMMRDGELFERQTLALTTEEPDCGWWPTPLASDVRRGVETMEALRARSRKKGNDYCSFIGVTGTRLHPNLREALMGWPINWTAIALSEMGKFPNAWKPHGKF